MLIFIVGVVLLSSPPKVLVDESVSVEEVRAIWPTAELTVVKAVLPDDKSLQDARRLCGAAREAAAALERNTSSLFAEAREAYLRAYQSSVSFPEITACILDHATFELEAGNQKHGVELLTEYISIGGQAPDPSFYSPRVTAQWRTLQQKRAEAIAFSITSLPDGAEVVLDGKRIEGQTPTTIPILTAGWHWVLVHKPYFRPYPTRVFVAPNNGSIVARMVPHSADAECLVSVEVTARKCQNYSAVIAQRSARLATKTIVDGQVRVRFVGSVRELATPITAPSSQASSAATAPVQLRSAVVPQSRRTHAAIAWMPFGIGQFAEQRYAAGTALLVTELLLLAAQVTTFALTFQGRLPNGRYVDQPSAQRAQSLQIANLVLAGVLAAEVIGGGIDGLMHREDR